MSSATTESPAINNFARSMAQNNSEPKVHTLLVTGELDSLFKFYQMYKEPHNLSQHFVYSWVANMASRKSAPLILNRNESNDLICNQLAEQWLDTSSSLERRERLLSESPIDLWPKIVSFIPLSRMRCLAHLASIWEKATDGQVTFADVLEWKLTEQSILLFEFESHDLDDVHNQLPMLKNLASYFPELSFVLRTIVTTVRNGNSLGNLKLVKEHFEILANGEEDHLTNHFQISENNGKTTTYRLHQLDPNSRGKKPVSGHSMRLLQTFQHLFRDPSKMAIRRGNTAPTQYFWYSLLNDASIEAFYEMHMPSVHMQKAFEAS